MQICAESKAPNQHRESLCREDCDRKIRCEGGLIRPLSPGRSSAVPHARPHQSEQYTKTARKTTATIQPGGTLTTLDDTCHPLSSSLYLLQSRISHRSPLFGALALSLSQLPAPSSHSMQQAAPGKCTAAVLAMLIVVGGQDIFIMEKPKGGYRDDRWRAPELSILFFFSCKDDSTPYLEQLAVFFFGILSCDPPDLC